MCMCEAFGTPLDDLDLAASLIWSQSSRSWGLEPLNRMRKSEQAVYLNHLSYSVTYHSNGSQVALELWDRVLDVLLSRVN